MSGASNNLFALQAARGRESWTQPTASPILNSPLVFEDPTNNNNKVVYAIESMDGRVRQFRAQNGRVNWEFNCAALTGRSACQDSVEAEFALSPRGNILYYGDVFGRIVGVEVATFVTPAPTGAPTKSPAPTGTPTRSPAPTRESARVPTSGPTSFLQGLFPTTSPGTSLETNAASSFNGEDDGATAGLLAGIVIGGLVFIGIAVCLVSQTLIPRKAKRSRGRAKSVNESETRGLKDPHDEDDNDDNDNDEDDDDYDEEASEYSEYSLEEREYSDVTVNSDNSDSIEVEVGDAYKTPSKRKIRRKRSNKAKTPPTPATLASIAESIAEEEDEEDDIIIIRENDEDDDDGSSVPNINLDDRFQMASQVASVAEHSEDPNVSVEVDMDEDSVDSDESVPPPPDAIPPPPPPPPPPIADHALFVDSDTSAYTSVYEMQDAAEEKKDGDEPPTTPDRSMHSQKSFLESVVEALSVVGSRPSSPVAPVGSGQTTPASRSGAVSPLSVASAVKTPPGRWDVKSLGSLMGSQLSPDRSTDSSLYVDDPGQSPIARPDDEPPTASFMLTHTLSTPILGANDPSLAFKPSISTPVNLAAHYGGNYGAPDDEASQDTSNMNAPGSHYMAKPMPLRPRFTASKGGVAEGVRSARAKREPIRGCQPPVSDRKSVV